MCIRDRGGGKGTRKQIIQNLEAEAKVDKVTIDTSGAKTAAAKNPIEIPTTVATSGATKGAQEAADAAQGVADRSGNRIEYKTKLDASTLQRDVNRAAASITPVSYTHLDVYKRQITNNCNNRKCHYSNDKI